MEKLININSYPINKVLKYLLMDKTTGKNIIWATDTYTTNGKYKDTDTIETVDLVGFDSLILQPRISKSLEEQQQRTRKKAEVFTPVWLCNHMNNYCDEQWFGRKDVFNIEREDHTWKVAKERIEFPKGKNWKKYIDSRRLEITCGEAPFLVSRYDMATGDLILPPRRRIGILDRKMRIVNENASDDDWLKWTIRAFQACYGYEYQGDNLLIARINMLLSFRDYYLSHFEEEPDLKLIKKIATIISWNLWQMDGLHDVVPKGSMNEVNHQFNLFEIYGNDNETEYKEDILSRVFNWRSNESLLYKECKGVMAMSKKLFDYCIGNPPYQDNTLGDNDGFAPPVYDKFIDTACKVAQKVELIHPARFLFNAGSTPKAWNEKMLKDPHFKVLEYESDCTKIFPNTDIKGGVAITYHDETQNYTPIGIFVEYRDMNSILKKVIKQTSKSIEAIGVSGYSYHFTEKMHRDYPQIKNTRVIVDGKEKPLLSKGHEYDLKSNVINKLPMVFLDSPEKNEKYVKIVGREGNERVVKYIKREYINDVVNLDLYKVFIPKASGIGGFGEPLGPSIIATPGMGHTETFFSIGNFNTEYEAENLLKYLKGKFSRALLSLLKKTQNITPGNFKYVPQQDFTVNSDIDWSKSIHDIDLQLYKKYGLIDEEINFIETNVKEMN